MPRFPTYFKVFLPRFLYNGHLNLYLKYGFVEKKLVLFYYK